MEKIKKQLNAKASLKPSGGGVFEVTVDGSLIYSKKKTGKFPDETELISKLKKL